jgi:hypothetical protein
MSQTQDQVSPQLNPWHKQHSKDVNTKLQKHKKNLHAREASKTQEGLAHKRNFPNDVTT